MWGAGDGEDAEAGVQEGEGDGDGATMGGWEEGFGDEGANELFGEVPFTTGMGDMDAVRERWDFVEQRDFSIYSTRQLNDKLHQAARDGNLAAINALTAAGAQVDAVQARSAKGFVARGWTPLFSAAYLGHYEAAERLLQLGANVSRVTEMAATPLEMAIAGPASARACADLVQLLLEYGAEVGRYSKAGWQPLHTAAYFGRCRCLVRLAELGADFSTRTLASNLSAIELARSHDRPLTAEVIAELPGRATRRRLVRRRASSPQPLSLAADAPDIGFSSEVMSAETIVATADKVQLWSETEDEQLGQEIQVCTL